MKTLKTYYMALLLLAMAAFTTACNSDEDAASSPVTEAQLQAVADNDAYIDTEMDFADQASGDFAVTASSNMRKALPAGVQVVREGGKMVVTYTDFKRNKHVTINGVIEVVHGDFVFPELKLLPKVKTVTYKDYSVVRNLPNGKTHKITMNGTRKQEYVGDLVKDLAKGVFTFKTTVSKSKAVVKVDGSEVEVTRDAEWFTTFYLNTAKTELAKFEVYGKASGVHKNGVAYSAEVKADAPVTYIYCTELADWTPVSGIKVVTTEKRTATIDFGKGECDKDFTVTIDKQAVAVSL